MSSIWLRVLQKTWFLYYALDVKIFKAKNMLDAYTIIGFIGALVILVAIIMNQLGRWQTNDFEFDFINLIGSAILAVYSWQIGSYPLLVLFIVWAIFYAKDVVGDGIHQLFKKGKKEESKKEEPENEENKGL
jgi:hypothetical protein